MVERAVYSLWTKPVDGEHVGFNSEKSLMECFALSLHYSKKWFKEVHLVTDLKGKELVEKYELKFDHINTDLESVMDGVYQNHWSLGKIYACKIQDAPFIHIDIDVILFKPLPETFLKSDAGFQNIETDEQEQWYKLLLDHADQNYLDKPVWFNAKNFKAYNCGIISFNKLELAKIWWDESLKYIEYLDNSNFDYNHHLSCLIYEQFAIYHLCNYYKYSVDLLTYYGTKDQKNLGWLPEDLAQKVGYTHLIASSKRRLDIEEKITNRVIKEKIKLPHLTYDTVCF
jgi:hypothetical protein